MVFYIAAFIIISFLIYIQLEHSKDFILTEYDIRLKNLYEDLENFRILHISDLHITEFGKREKKIIKVCKEEKPDIILITGDFVNNSYGIEACLKTMEDIKSPLGVWAVWGNNDNDLKGNDLKNGLKSFNIQILKNKSVFINFKNSGIRLIGVDDPYKRKDNLKKAMEKVMDGEIKILLSHSPEIIHKASKAEIDLVLCGHTHGGQIRFPIIGAIYNHTWDLFRYSAGFYRVINTQMFVSRGLGMSLIPIRFLCPAEMTIIKLKKEH